MTNNIDAERVLALAKSEVKRWGGDGPSLTHVAYVLARECPTEFTEQFGDGGRGMVTDLLRQRQFLGDEATARHLLTAAPDMASAIRSIRESLSAMLPTPETEPASDGAGTADSMDAAPAALSPRTSSFLHRVVPKDAPSLLRAVEAADIGAHLLRPDKPVVAMIGDPGVGRTATITEVATRLASARTPLPVWRMGVDTAGTNVANALSMVLTAVESPAVIVIDDLDELCNLGTDQPDRRVLELVSEGRFHAHARLLVVLNRRRAARLALFNQGLDEAMVKVMIPALAADDARAVASDAASAHAAAAGLTLAPGVLDAALAAPPESSPRVHPGLAIQRVDSGIGRALLEGADAVTVEHLSGSGNAHPVGVESSKMKEALLTRVRGQDEAVLKVSERLALTRTGLDLRPQRPNGVFLFAGPTGVGKTELAMQIAVAEYGSADNLIRLDMSEYSHDWAVSRIAGPMPGYVGSTEPEGWLTTKVAGKPHSVVLLDEIEKAHPGVWNMFLQVFDAGRLTDSRGVTADFSNTVIVMTSNLGAREAGAAAVGFGGGPGGVARQWEVIRAIMAPELLNRVDEVILFRPLEMESIEEIAQMELAAVTARLNSLGWLVDYGPEVIRWLARTGYDPAFGGRHLQRNIEREFLGLLAKAPNRRLTVTVADDRLSTGA